MKTIVFDTSTIISLVTNNLLGLLKPLKEKYGIEFYIPKTVAYELVEKPLESKMYKLEALMVKKIINDEDIKIYKEEIDVEELLYKITNLFYANGKPIKIVSKAEVEALALAVNLGANAYAVDERTMRLIIENTMRLKKIQENKLHMKIGINKESLNTITRLTSGIKVIRSTEIALIAYEQGLMEKYVVNTTKKEVVEALLWGLKLRGCSISREEVEELVKEEIRK